jgi:hypothetical protein
MDWRAEFSHSSPFEKNKSVVLVGVLRKDEVPVVLRAQRTTDNRRSTVAGSSRASQRETARILTPQRTEGSQQRNTEDCGFVGSYPTPGLNLPSRGKRERVDNFDRFLNFCGSR